MIKLYSEKTFRESDILIVKLNTNLHCVKL